MIGSLKSWTTLALVTALILPGGVAAKTVEYDMTISRVEVNFTGTPVLAMGINGSIPGPTLRFEEGDRALIRVRNDMGVETSVHWHGLLLPNAADGVPYLTTPPILPGGTHAYEFDLRQSGTYWYHSHTMLQEQRGVYGSIVVEPRGGARPPVPDLVLVLSDWTDEDPMEVLRTLKRGSEWYAMRKGAVQSWDRVIARGKIRDRLRQAWERMPPMDISDVAYDRFLVNGRPEIAVEDLEPGQKLRLRVINAGASTYFHVQFAGGPLTIVAADGPEVEPVEVERVLMGIAETYDFIVTIPAADAWEFRATAQDGTGRASAFLGSGERWSAPDVPKPDPFSLHGMHAMGGMGGMAGAGHGSMSPGAMDEGAVSGGTMPAGSMASGAMSGGTMAGHGAAGFDYSLLRSPGSTLLPEGRPLRDLRLNLTGDMERYVWGFDGKTLSEVPAILVRRGENVRLTFVNETMMHHPIHLHGHFFRVVSGQGDRAPLKHTVDVPPLETVVIEFAADDDGDWLLHCHILYHMMSGMTRVVRYEGWKPDPALAAFGGERKLWHDRDWWYWGEAAALSQKHEGEFTTANNRYRARAMWEGGWDGELEADVDLERVFSRFLGVYAGGTLEIDHGVADHVDAGPADGHGHADGSREEAEGAGIAGVRYLLPLGIDSDLRVDTRGWVRLEVGSSLHLTERLGLDWMVDTDGDWEVGLHWVVARRLALAAAWDSHHGAGAGIRVEF